MISIYCILFLLVSILTQSNGQVSCALGWVQYGGNCYLIKPAFNSGSFGGTWDQCHAYCSASYSGASMLCINNATENSWMYSQYQGSVFWIGYTDMLPYGGGKATKQYGWVTGCSSTFTNWKDNGQPDNDSNFQDYAAVWPDGIWEDYYNNDVTLRCGCQYKPAALSSGPTSSPSATPSFRSSVGDVNE